MRRWLVVLLCLSTLLSSSWASVKGDHPVEDQALQPLEQALDHNHNLGHVEALHEEPPVIVAVDEIEEPHPNAPTAAHPTHPDFDIAHNGGHTGDLYLLGASLSLYPAVSIASYYAEPFDSEPARAMWNLYLAWKRDDAAREPVLIRHSNSLEQQVFHRAQGQLLDQRTLMIKDGAAVTEMNAGELAAAGCGAHSGNQHDCEAVRAHDRQRCLFVDGPHGKICTKQFYGKLEIKNGNHFVRGNADPRPIPAAANVVSSSRLVANHLLAHGPKATVTQIRNNWKTAAVRAECDILQIEQELTRMVIRNQIPRFLVWVRCSDWHADLNLRPEVLRDVIAGFEAALVDHENLDHRRHHAIRRRPIGGFIGQAIRADNCWTGDEARTALEHPLFQQGTVQANMWDKPYFKVHRAQCMARDDQHETFCATMTPLAQQPLHKKQAAYTACGRSLCCQAKPKPAEAAISATAFECKPKAGAKTDAAPTSNKVCWSYYLTRLADLGVWQMGFRSGSPEGGILAGIPTLKWDVQYENGIVRGYMLSKMQKIATVSLKTAAQWRANGKYQAHVTPPAEGKSRITLTEGAPIDMTQKGDDYTTALGVDPEIMPREGEVPYLDRAQFQTAVRDFVRSGLERVVLPEEGARREFLRQAAAAAVRYIRLPEDADHVNQRIAELQEVTMKVMQARGHVKWDESGLFPEHA